MVNMALKEHRHSFCTVISKYIMKRLYLFFPGVFMLIGSFFLTGFSTKEDPFFNDASQTNISAIKAGKLAVSKGSATIKQLGRRMMADFKTAQKELIRIGKRQNLHIEKQPDAGHKHLLDSLKSLSGKEFDAAFIKYQVAGHQASIALFKDESVNGADSKMKEYAGKYLPLLEMHLNMFKGDSSAMKMTVDSPRNK